MLCALARMFEFLQVGMLLMLQNTFEGIVVRYFNDLQVLPVQILNRDVFTEYTENYSNVLRSGMQLVAFLPCIMYVLYYINNWTTIGSAVITEDGT